MSKQDLKGTYNDCFVIDENHYFDIQEEVIAVLKRRIEIALTELKLLRATAEYNKDYLTVARIAYLQELLK